ncbi:hypothetical protein [uncultured Sphingomonas sp.]|uniref:hypothetical protein n=1 Tax=uncultured Sphingomonas sp. TaxID=158754 RepID=UPI0035CC24AE
MISDILRGLRDIMVLSEKLANTTAIAKQADQRSIAFGDRLARVEAVLQYALHGNLPKGSPPPSFPSLSRPDEG